MSAVPNSQRQVAVVPHNSTNFADGPCEFLWIGTAGTINYIPADPAVPNGTDATAIATSAPQGVFPFKVKRVNATGTAAALIVACY